MEFGNYTGLAEPYSRYRPDYSSSVLRAILALAGKNKTDMDAVDIGAGTGIWTRMLSGSELRSVIAVEPNDDMRRCGQRDTPDVSWQKGTGEHTGLADNCADLVSMASSFHWVDTEAGLYEFHRLLRPGGRFVALWNPRMTELSPVLSSIEQKLAELHPNLQRISSGKGNFAAKMNDILWHSTLFDDVIYLEGRHTVHQTPEEYLGTWTSVNEVQVRLGPSLFHVFLDYVQSVTRDLPYVETTYMTRAWCARRVS
ncbi:MULTISPECIES: class I SAM-dependent methyltransferase [unclassified Haematospirillum]|uniref:class I SAM-dependent methyltransferase n=1 Tax=unclassified Haematospirillum TaxID=2622088 RepID=UPI0014399791|nr:MULTISPECIES: class I SAM-dependent methyltransferase [unclassified Haematospirillum]NKD56078.1 class I SAM-dependent methyltransferase [Haematospirillum sp. H4890]NKD76125.1 class I SAM-dependent methyltransferase [Haematospirillum sp. H4485]NKD88673.1 class I SAM-dependent methyltransferase [Haematospirillum sp. 15-248]